MEKSRSYIKPIKSLVPQADHRAHKGLNNAIEVSHRPTRKREKLFGRFKSHRHAHRFLSAHAHINLIFRPRRYQLSSISYRHARSDAFSLWDDYTAEMIAREGPKGNLQPTSNNLGIPEAQIGRWQRVLGAKLHGRKLETQKTETRIANDVPNRMTADGCANFERVA